MPRERSRRDVLRMANMVRGGRPGAFRVFATAGTAAAAVDAALRDLVAAGHVELRHDTETGATLYELTEAGAQAAAGDGEPGAEGRWPC